ncbi:MAG TPA: ANTAR domain-containing protein [Candidatus Lachnoclostridium pullistercoris]|uniref:ANTAR domain-containing protein n=1 Tax=Candidatus Lachnoclostridium pullistercoris TaxID=2838632 RepID=A0A9D2T5R3_9FIRM|nr:ANTAR domain-containing protein [Candidatus Lachnoclostridium pullistercoris]
MKGIVIVFSREEDGKKIGRALERNGFQNAVCCLTGAQALQEASVMDGGIVISSVRLKDMHCSQLREYLPDGVELLVIGPEARLSDCPPDVMTVSAPIRVFDLVNTVRMMMSRGDVRRPAAGGGKRGGPSAENVRRKKTRSPEDEKSIREAKCLLMERNRLSEEAAHRYLQKRSMETGRTMAESARMILVLYENE